MGTLDKWLSFVSHKTHVYPPFDIMRSVYFFHLRKEKILGGETMNTYYVAMWLMLFHFVQSNIYVVGFPTDNTSLVQALTDTVVISQQDSVVIIKRNLI